LTFSAKISTFLSNIIVCKRPPPDLTPLLHEDASESNGYSHEKAVSNLFGIVSKGHAWINPGDDIDFTAVNLWLRI
jgi:hypothetical protein